MASPVVALQDQIQTLWEALTPPTDTVETYTRLTGREPSGRNRNFWFDFPIRDQVVAEAADESAAQVRWLLNARLLVAEQGRGVKDHMDAVTNESNLLMRTVEKQTSWPANVLEVITQRTDGFEVLEDGDVIVSLVIATVVAETD